MKKHLLLILVCGIVFCGRAAAQSIHFSQYYNAPMLLNPANTALLPENDFRIGLNYRNQWSALPVPYNTFSGFADFKVGGNSSNENHNNWLGLGLTFFNDKAGDGNLALSQFQGNIAYHLGLSSTFMLSLGLSGSYVQRSVNYDNLTFNAQWDGFTFNPHMANGEKIGILKTNYYSTTAGINFAIFPNENLYIKLGGSLANINKPTESFYKQNNQIEMRPIGNLDVVIKTGPVLIINPSVYYSTQYGASELVAGAQFRTMLSASGTMPSQLILGVFDRIGDAVIGVAGMQIGDWQLTANYDFTMSGLAPYNASYGALEFSLIYTRKYYNNKGIKRTYSCPVFF